MLRMCLFIFGFYTIKVCLLHVSITQEQVYRVFLNVSTKISGFLILITERRRSRCIDN